MQRRPQHLSAPTGPATTLVLTLVIALSAAGAPAQSTPEEVSLAAPEALDAPPALTRFARLTPRQRGALRRGFKLPLDALFAASTPRELAAKAVVAPLPDPNKPLLPVPASGPSASPMGGDPFGASDGSNALGVLGKYFAAERAARVASSGESSSGATAPAPARSAAEPPRDANPFGEIEEPTAEPPAREPVGEAPDAGLFENDPFSDF